MHKGEVAKGNPPRITTEPIVVPKHQSRGLSIERLVISLYAKGMSVADIESEMQEIYGINLSSSAISIITKKLARLQQSGRIVLWTVYI